MALVESFSGIRGIWGKDLNESAAIKYAHAYATFLKNKTGKKNPVIVIGRDTRPSGKAILDSIRGIIDVNLIDVGILPTPAIELAVRHFNADGGIIITASHNEPFWNGFKFLGNDGAILNENEMNLVISGSKRLDEFHKIQERKVLEKRKESLEKYCEFIFDLAGKENIENIKNAKLKVVLDPNGGAGIIAKEILESAGVEVIGINMNYGEFNRQVEPTEDALIYLKNIIDDNNADFAAAFDCDADRIGIMMDTGQVLSGNYILAIVVDEMLSNIKNPKSQTVVVNDATSGIVGEIAKKHSAKIKEVEAGETNVVEEMKKSKSIVGGEGSSGGAIISPSKCRDGILTLLSIMSIIGKRNIKLSEIVDSMPVYFSLRKKIEYNPKKHGKIKGCIKEYYIKKGFEIRETRGIKGGLKAVSGDSFVWFRASKTESNVFRIISDSKSNNGAEELLEEAVKIFKKANEEQ